MYDDPKKKEALCTVTLRGPWGAGESVAVIGVDGRISRDRYVVTEPWGDELVATTVLRKTGWHDLVLAADSERGYTLVLDGKVVGIAPLLKYFTILDAGDAEFGSDSRGLGFDTFAIE